MSIQVDCTECGQRMVDGVLQHTPECSANNFKTISGIGQMSPGQIIHFDTPEEQKAFMDNLSGGSSHTPVRVMTTDQHNGMEGENNE